MRTMGTERRADEQAEWSTADRVSAGAGADRVSAGAVGRGEREETSATIWTERDYE